MLRLSTGAMLVATILASGHAAAQPYPSRPITLMHPFGAGSGADQSVRVLAEEFARVAGSPMVVDARPGGNGMIALQAVKRAAPDGYTLLLTTNSTQVYNAILYKDLPVNPATDFAPVAGLEILYLALIVPTDSPAKSYGELVSLARQRGGMTFASSSGVSRIAGELFKQTARLDLVNVPYKAAPASVADVVSGRVDLVFATLIEAGGMLRTGKLRALAVTAPKRLGARPELATLDELGLPGFEASIWSAFYAPLGIAEPIVARLHETLTRASASPAMEKFRAPGSAEPLPLDAAALARFQSAEIARARKVAAAAGITPE